MSLVLPYMPASMMLPALADDLVLPSIETIEVLLIEQGIQYVLSNDTGITALVSDRIYSPVLPQTVVYPAIALRLVSRRQIDQLGNRGSTGLAMSLIAIYSTSKGPSRYGQCKRIAEAVRLALQGYRGTISVAGFASLFVQYVSPQGAHDFYDDSTQTHQVESMFEVWASEQQPPALSQ